MRGAQCPAPAIAAAGPAPLPPRAGPPAGPPPGARAEGASLAARARKCWCCGGGVARRPTRPSRTWGFRYSSWRQEGDWGREGILLDESREGWREARQRMQKEGVSPVFTAPHWPQGATVLNTLQAMGTAPHPSPQPCPLVASWPAPSWPAAHLQRPENCGVCRLQQRPQLAQRLAHLRTPSHGEPPSPQNSPPSLPSAQQAALHCSSRQHHPFPPLPLLLLQRPPPAPYMGSAVHAVQRRGPAPSLPTHPPAWSPSPPRPGAAARRRAPLPGPARAPTRPCGARPAGWWVGGCRHSIFI